MSEDYMNHTWGCRCVDCTGVSCTEEDTDESHVPSCQCSECKDEEEES